MIKYLVGNGATVETPVSEVHSNGTDRKTWWLDLTQSSYGADDGDKWYPVIMQVQSGNIPTDITVSRGYSQSGNALGGLNVRVMVNGSSWGGNSMQVYTKSAHETYIRMCLGWGWFAHGQYFGFALRGDFSYYITMTQNIHNLAPGLNNHSATNSGHGPQVLTSSTIYYDHANNAYDKTAAPVTSATDSKMTNQTGYWNGTAIVSPTSGNINIATMGL